MFISLVCTLFCWISISHHPDDRLYSSCSQQGAWTGDKPGLLDLLRRWYALLGARQAGTPSRGTNTRHCTPLNVLWRWHLLRHRATIHHRAAWKWPSPLHGQYVYSFLTGGGTVGTHTIFWMQNYSVQFCYFFLISPL